MLMLYDRDEKLIASLKYNNVERKRELNGLNTLEFETSKEVEFGQRTLFKDKNGLWNEYIIFDYFKNHENNDVTYSVYCEDSTSELYWYFVDDLKPRNEACSSILKRVLEGTRFEVGYVDDFPKKSFNLYRESVKSCLWKMLDQYGAEINVRIVVDKTGILHRYIDLRKKIGRDVGKRFTYKKDTGGIKKTTSIKDLATALHGYGKGEEIVKEDGTPSRNEDKIGGGDYGRKIDFSEINGGKTYVEDNEARLKYGLGKERRHIFGQADFPDCEDKHELLRLTKEKLKEVSKPKITYELNVEDISRYEGYIGEGVDLGDVVYVIDKEIDTRVQTRVISIKDNPVEEIEDSEIVLGNFIKDLSDNFATYEKLKSTFENERSKFNQELDKLANGVKSSYIQKILDKFNRELNETGGWVYAEEGEGILILNAPKDGNPTQAINLKGGKIAIANHKNADGSFAYETFGDGDGFTANLIRAGVLRGGKVFFNLEDGTFLIGESRTNYSMYWDGGTLHFRNVDIDLKNSKDFSQIKDDLEKKISKDDILEDKEIQEALKGKDGKDGIDGQAGKDGKDGHILTVEVWLEGEFRNYKTKNVKKIIQAKYDGELIDLDSTNTEVYNCYGNGEWSRATLSDFWADWDRQYEYIANKVIVTYKGLKAEAYARLDNIKDGEKGDKGDTGKQGIPGKDGLNGKNGIDGKDGKTGKIGQNLLRNSNVAVSNKLYNTKEWTLCETPITGETMTFTAKIKLEKDDKLMVYNSGGMIHLNWWDEITKSQDYVIYSSTFNWRDKIEYNGKTYEQTNPPTLRLYTYSNGKGENFNNNNVSIEWATLTRGDIPAIEWTPCYADVDDAIKAGKEESEEISRKLIKVESDFKVENNNIKASVSSLSETTERSFVNLKKDMADADVKVETGIKNYVINNYSTKTQTDQKISNEVGSIKTSLGKDINDLNKEVTEAKSMVEQTQRGVSAIVGEVERGLDDKINNLNARVDIQADKIEAKVSKDGFASLVKQEFDSYTVQAKNIDFEGSYVNVKGTFQTLNTSDDVGVEMSYNQVVWKDNRWEGKTFGKITVTKIVGSEYGFSLNFGHYPTGFLSMSYWNNDDKKWYSYMQLDKWNYTGNGGITPIIFHENLNCLRHSIRIGNWELVPQGDTLKIKPYDTKAGYIFQRGGLYRYYASGGKDVKTKID